MRCTRSRGPRGLFCLHVFRRGPVNAAVIRLGDQNTMRFSIATMLLLTLLVAGYFPIKILFAPWQQARIASQHPLYALHLDNAELHVGDTIQSAARIFPTMKFVEPDSQVRKKLEHNMKMMGGKLPEDSDLYQHNSHGVLGFLTFRDGKLIRDYDYDNPVSNSQLRAITPSLWFRSGIFPIYAMIASLLLAAWVLLGKWHQSNWCRPEQPYSQSVIDDGNEGRPIAG